MHGERQRTPGDETSVCDVQWCPKCGWQEVGMPRPVWSGTISFGLVAIPVKLFHAVRRQSVSFNQLDERNMARIRYRKVTRHSTESSRTFGLTRSSEANSFLTTANCP